MLCESLHDHNKKNNGVPHRPTTDALASESHDMEDMKGVKGADYGLRNDGTRGDSCPEAK